MSDTEARFWQAVDDRPDEPVSLLLLADWLDDISDPRAHAIRWLVEREYRPGLGPTSGLWVWCYSPLTDEVRDLYIAYQTHYFDGTSRSPSSAYRQMLDAWVFVYAADTPRATGRCPHCGTERRSDDDAFCLECRRELDGSVPLLVPPLPSLLPPPIVLPPPRPDPVVVYVVGVIDFYQKILLHILAIVFLSFVPAIVLSGGTYGITAVVTIGAIALVRQIRRYRYWDRLIRDSEHGPADDAV